MSVRKFIHTILICVSTIIHISSASAATYGAQKEERVKIVAGDVTLGATLYWPNNASDKTPAIVTAHGSAPSDRDGVGFYTQHALKLGFAVLSFDKRGVGESSGEYKKFNVETSDTMMNDLAMDVAYSVRWLVKQPGIDADRIGLFGGSQAGWVMPLAATKEPAIKFIITGEGTPVTAGEEAIHGDIGGDGAGWDYKRIQLADDYLRNMDGDHGFDPQPYLNELEIPILWIFGLRDDVIPVNVSLERIEKLIKQGKINNTVHVFPFGDHNFTNIATGERYDLNPIIQNWLVENNILSENR